MNSLKDILKFIEENDSQASIRFIEDSEIDAIDKSLLKAKIHYKNQKWGELINEYNKVLEINPENAEAKSGIEMAKSILGFFNPDMFNP